MFILSRSDGPAVSPGDRVTVTSPAWAQPRSASLFKAVAMRGTAIQVRRAEHFWILPELEERHRSRRNHSRSQQKAPRWGTGSGEFSSWQSCHGIVPGDSCILTPRHSTTLMRDHAR